MTHPQTPSDDTPTPKPKKVRDAGPDAMENSPEKWNDVDEASDESFPGKRSASEVLAIV